MFSVDIVLAQIVLRRSARRSQQVAMRNVLRVSLVNLNIATFHSKLGKRAPRVLLFNLKVATLRLELRESASRATFVLKSSELAAGAPGTYFARYFCT